MLHKGPHFSIAAEHLIPRVLGIELSEYEQWPQAVRELALDLAGELFLVRYNPFIPTNLIRESVRARFNRTRKSLAEEFVGPLSDALRRFWSTYDKDRAFRHEIIRRLGQIMPEENIDTRPNSRVETATDATDLRMELPLLVVMPSTVEQVRDIVKLANEMEFALVPRGGGSGATGGAVPTSQRTVILSLSKLRDIVSVDPESMTLCVEAGVITIDAINAAAQKGLLFTVDPASKTASSIGGNISENSGGPFAFEYGTTIDNIASYRMVTPTGGLIEVKRRDHPGHKIMAEETAVFDVYDDNDTLLHTVELPGDQIRGKDLGKDVTNKFLGGLPGVQKEGVDGIIVDACFTCYTIPAHSRVLCLEFFGRSLKPATLVIKDIVALRNTIREQGDLVKISALEEFGIKYVQAIEYSKKSEKYEGDPISVIIVQLDSDDENALNQAVDSIVNIVEPYDQVDVLVAADAKEGEIFWEDRHKLSAIARRTSGFKINEDIVIPIDIVPTFAEFLEQLNLEYTAKAYRYALQEIGRLPNMGVHDKFINMEFNFTSQVLMGEVKATEISDEELLVQVMYFFRDLKSRYPHIAEGVDQIHERLLATRVVIANHMHAGDGNCHVNIPVNSNDHVMLENAEEAAHKVMAKVKTLGGEVTGEHGIGITKIAFLDKEKREALTAYKAQVDPKNILNPDKLTRPDLPVKPYTFSFNRLIEDIRATGLPDKDKLINLLTHVQICTRCGKCKQVCPMYQPLKGMLFHPRNKNISLGALIEAIYYTKVMNGEPDPSLLNQLRKLVEHCTGCGKCTSVCPVKIDSPAAAMDMRAMLESEGAGGHPIKSRVLELLAKSPSGLVPMAAKAAGVGQAVTNRAVGLVPASWRGRARSPLFTGQGPETGWRNLVETLKLADGSVFLPANHDGRGEAVFYFPGCGAGLFYKNIGLAAVQLLIDSGTPVVLPPEHLCCGYPLLVSGCEEAFTTNRARNIAILKEIFAKARAMGLKITTVLTSCGSCRDGLGRYELIHTLAEKPVQMDVTQYLIEQNPTAIADAGTAPETLLYHAACHAEWAGQKASKASAAYAKALTQLTGSEIAVSPGCCGESGLGALTSPEIYNNLRDQKQQQLAQDLNDYPDDNPVIVGCPSCKIGIKRSLMHMKHPHEVLHTLEYMAQSRHGKAWQKQAAKLRGK